MAPSFAVVPGEAALEWPPILVYAGGVGNRGISDRNTSHNDQADEEIQHMGHKLKDEKDAKKIEDRRSGN